MNDTIHRVTERVRERSRALRSTWLDRMKRAEDIGPHRHHLGCSNLAHGAAGCRSLDQQRLLGKDSPNIAIVSSYNDMLSAHQPLGSFPARIKAAAARAGAVAQFAGGVPAMCDGVTQGTPGMELSLFSRDVIAMATAVALSHDMFDAALCLGICDKIVPGLLIGALSFAQMPVIFVPGGPMPSGISNAEKQRVRMLAAEGKVGREALLEAEAGAYHSPGTCTFYGTANTNQMMVEIMGLHLPGASFVNPGTDLRNALTEEAARRAVALTRKPQGERTPLYEVVDERSLINGIVGLHATGGSTNHTLHMVAIARAAGIVLTWDDFSDLSQVVPLITRVYPNGNEDVNAFQAAGGMPFLISELLDAGLLHEDVQTVVGQGLDAYRKAPALDGDLRWEDGPTESRNPEVLTTTAAPFAPTGGLRLLKGNLGRAVMKVSAVAAEHRVVEAPAVVFDDQSELLAAFSRGELDRDFVAVVRFQGPRANGMPELHKLTPTLAVLQGRGHKVALVTDGRMSGASGKVPAAIHVTPESAAGGPLSRVRDGDLVTVDGVAGVLRVHLDEAALADREPETFDPAPNEVGIGRELFGGMRAAATGAEQGATTFGWPT